MLLLHALLFLFFGTWAAALPVPGLPLYRKPRPATRNEPDHNIHWNVPRNAVGFWRRDAEETKKFIEEGHDFSDIFYVTLLDNTPDIQLWSLRPQDEPREPSDAPMVLDGNLDDRENLEQLGKKWFPLPAHLVPHGYPRSATVNPDLVAHIKIKDWKELTIEVKPERRR
ncbi:hypothetical protein F5887DRAFT_1010166 [Amanita rubescens]|nr:hypothetical protein F5887DRAFT_1290656 [Amanita rubescens]KAF8327844.1 hypothetical protein F5887DRAFT_1010166 [Amanita rubescens]